MRKVAACRRKPKGCKAVRLAWTLSSKVGVTGASGAAAAGALAFGDKETGGALRKAEPGARK